MPYKVTDHFACGHVASRSSDQPKPAGCQDCLEAERVAGIADDREGYEAMGKLLGVPPRRRCGGGLTDRRDNVANGNTRH